MSAIYSIGQMNQLGDALEAEGFTPDEVTKLRHPGVLAQVKLVLMGLATIVVASFKLVLNKALNPPEFIGKDWSFWKGPADGNGLEGDEDYVAEPDVVDFSQIVLDTHLQGEETSINGEEKMRRARADKTKLQLGEKAFFALWSNWLENKKAGKPEESTLEKLRRAGKIDNVVYFFNHPLRGPGGVRGALCLCFGGREWSWYCAWLVYDWDARSPSASLASVK